MSSLTAPPPSWLRRGIVAMLHAGIGGAAVKPVVVTSEPFEAAGLWCVTTTGCNAWVACASLSQMRPA